MGYGIPAGLSSLNKQRAASRLVEIIEPELEKINEAKQLKLSEKKQLIKSYFDNIQQLDERVELMNLKPSDKSGYDYLVFEKSLDELLLFSGISKLNLDLNNYTGEKIRIGVRANSIDTNYVNFKRNIEAQIHETKGSLDMVFEHNGKFYSLDPVESEVLRSKLSNKLNTYLEIGKTIVDKLSNKKEITIRHEVEKTPTLK